MLLGTQLSNSSRLVFLTWGIARTSPVITARGTDNTSVGTVNPSNGALIPIAIFIANKVVGGTLMLSMAPNPMITAVVTRMRPFRSGLVPPTLNAQHRVDGNTSEGAAPGNSMMTVMKSHGTR